MESGSASVPPTVARTVAELRARLEAWRRAGDSIGLVPTMGALHAGHLSLIRKMCAEANRVVVSIFVNPAQFGPNEDYGKYPRQEAEDLEKIGAIGAHLAFIPSVEEMYPEGFDTTVSVPGLSACLCGATRPGHFDGVATVVAKLLLQCRPDAAIFGEKDYQQLLVIRRLVRDLDMPVRILSGPTTREDDGLALSSRNAYLGPRNRKKAAALPETLKDLCARAAEGEDLARLEKAGCKALLEAGFSDVDYLEFRSGKDLAKLKKIGPAARLFAAARIGGTRLIDNMPVEG